MKIVILDQNTLEDLSWESLHKLGDVTIYMDTPDECIEERTIEADIVITNKTVINRAVIEAAKNLKYIGVTATGYNIVDTQAASERGVVVTNVPAYGTDAVAQYVMAAILFHSNRIDLHSESVKNGDWMKNGNFSYWLRPLVEVAGKTVGIIGFGKIGYRVMELCRAFNMNILVYNRSKKEREDGFKYSSLNEIYEKSDYISMHLPLTAETEKIINEEALLKMKENAVFINSSRGGLVDEEALIRVLESGHLAMAILDAVSEEPIKDENKLLGIDRCIITPHYAWAPTETRQRLVTTVIQNIKAFIEGDIQNQVNG